MKIIITTLVFCAVLFFLAACDPSVPASDIEVSNDDTIWPDGKKAAVILTYDDSLVSHLDHAIPQLNEAGLVGTFYLTIAQPTMLTRQDEWRAAAKVGHELGNHTIHHPCQKNKQDRSWVQDYQNLDKYNHWQFTQELLAVDVALRAIDGETQRSFAYPCVDILVGGESIVPKMREIFVGARAMSETGLLDPNNFDAHLLPSLNVAGKTGEELIAIVNSSLPESPNINGGAIILMFHGVGGDHLSVSAESHQALLNYLSSNKSVFWTATAKQLLQHLAD